MQLSQLLRVSSEQWESAWVSQGLTNFCDWTRFSKEHEIECHLHSRRSTRSCSSRLLVFSFVLALEWTAYFKRLIFFLTLQSEKRTELVTTATRASFCVYCNALKSQTCLILLILFVFGVCFPSSSVIWLSIRLLSSLLLISDQTYRNVSFHCWTAANWRLMRNE